MQAAAHFLFFGSLNDFLPKVKRNTQILYGFTGNPAVKDAIEALGVPHPEVTQILINNNPTGFGYKLQNGDVVTVFPAEHSDALLGSSLQPPLPAEIKFILDVHLGKLAKALRILGFDTAYRNDFSDSQIAAIAEQENRIVLTRDVGLLKIKTVQWGYWLRSQFLEEQLTEVIGRFKLENLICPFTRCLACNGRLLAVPKDEVYDELPPNTRLYYQEFYQCQQCHKVYWKGSHYESMEKFIEKVRSGK